MPPSPPEVSDALQPLSNTAQRSLARAYGRTPRVQAFFELYSELKAIQETDFVSEESGLYRQFRVASSQLDSMITQEATRNRLADKVKVIEPLLRRLDRRGRRPGAKSQVLPDALWKVLIDAYSDIIQGVAADKEIYLTQRRMPGTGTVRWWRLQRASPKEEKIEDLRRTDPDLYERTQESRRQRRVIMEKIKARIEADGLEPAVRRIMNRPMNVGIGPGGLMVYDTDGDVLTLPEFADKIKGKREVADNLTRVNPAQYMWAENLDFLRQYSKDDMDSVPGRAEYLALTDDPTKESALTRIYPVKVVEGKKVVSEGRFTGIPVSSLVNRVGRQIEGSSYSYNQQGRITRREIRKSDGKLDVRRTSEPYVTLDGDKFLIHIPMQRPFDHLRKLMKGHQEKYKDPDTGKRRTKTHRGLVQDIPTVNYVEKSRGTEYTFTARDFAIVQETLGGMALSHSAAKALRDYYDELSRAEQAAQAENLSRYSNDSLGFRDKPNLRIRGHVKQSLAWLDANDNKGICALDTGMGKTVVAIAAMMNLLKKGETGRFMYVTEGKLTGNLPKEAYKFLPRDSAAELMKQVDIVSYDQMIAARRKDPTYGDGYLAIYFDEAHTKLSKRSWVGYKAAVGMQSAHKVLLTASPMTRSPMEVLTMASVANGEDLNSPEGQLTARKFSERFSESVGGRIVGVTQDPSAARDLRVWVKRNLFFADKRDVEEEGAALALTGMGKSGRDIKREPVAVTMPPSIESAYRETMSEMLEALQEWSKFGSFKDNIPLGVEVSRNRLQVKRLLKRLSLLSDTPDQVLPGVGNPKLDHAMSLVRQALSGRTLLFTDSEQMAQDAFARLQRDLPAQGLVLGLSDRILYLSPSGEETRYGKRKGRNSYVDEKTGRKIDPDEWASHVLNKILGLGTKQRPDKPVCAAVLTGHYALGQNLQSFATVIHLDRDDWNAETMKQRTARAWRSGNKQEVSEYTLDMVYPDAVADDNADQTLDEIRSIVQEIDGKLFDEVVLESQIEKLGEEWIKIKKQRSQFHAVSRRMLERSLSPYASHLGEDEV
jgi:hypothetical protein